MKSSDTGGAFRNTTIGANVRLQTAIPHIDLKRIRSIVKIDTFKLIELANFVSLVSRTAIKPQRN